MSSQKKKVQCSRFEPQAWRKTLCKNCFKTKNEHAEEAFEEPQTPDYMSDGASSPEVLSGDKIIVRRSFVTPPRECQVTDFPGLGRRGSDVSGRRTPTSEEQRKDEAEEKPRQTTTAGEEKKNALKEKRCDAGFRNEANIAKSETVSLTSNKTPSITSIVPVDTASQVPLAPAETFSQTPLAPAETLSQTPLAPVVSPPKTPLAPVDRSKPENVCFRPNEPNNPTEKQENSSGREMAGKADSDSSKPYLLPFRSSSSSPSPSSEALRASDGDAAPVGDKTKSGGFESFKDKSGKRTEDLDQSLTKQRGTEKSDIEATCKEASLSINNLGSQPVGNVGQGADLAVGASSALSRQRELGRESVQQCMRSLDNAKAQGQVDTKDGVERGGGEKNISSSSNSNHGQADARTEIAQAGAESAEGSYVQSLRISLLSPVNTEAVLEAAVGVDEPRNSYSIRHGGGSTAAASGPGDRQAQPEQNTSRSIASTVVTQFQLAKPNLGDLSSQESLSNDDRPVAGLNTPQQVAKTDSRSPESSVDRAKVEAGRATGSTAPPPGDELLNNSQPFGSKSGYQYVDASDSRVSYNIVDEGAGRKSAEGNFYYLTNKNGESEPYSVQPGSGSNSQDQEELKERTSGPESSTDQPRRKVTSLFHHVPGDGNGYTEDSPSPGQRWASTEPPLKGQFDEDSSGYSSPVSQQQQQPGSGSRRRRRSRVISLDDDLGARTMSGFGDYGRSDAMMEGTRLVMESLREKVAQLQEQIERQEREKGVLGDLLTAKKSDYEMMKDHFNGMIGNLEMEVQRLKSEKSRLLDKLQLPESERASLTSEENEIAELKRRLEEYENRYTESVGENEDLKQEVRDLQLEMEEMHDQFREEETIEFRELQKELENTAKNCRILQFKLRKAERRNEQLESDRIQYDEKLRHYESCFQSSDDKRRIRVLEEDLRLARESSVRLHAELERAEERHLKHQEELDRAKNSVNEADNRRLCLQNELDSMKHEMTKVRDQLRFDGRQDVIKSGIFKISSTESDATAAQLAKDLKDSLERENDLKEQLKFSEEENITMRKKLLEMEEETESMSHQLRKLSAAKSGRYTKGKVGDVDNEPVTERENDLRLQMELAEQEVKVLKRKMDELQQDNDNLLCAIKYLRAKLEQRDGLRSATPIGETKNTKDLLMRLGAPGPDEVTGDGGGPKDEVVEQLLTCQKEVLGLRQKIIDLEKENARLIEDCKKLHSPRPASTAPPEPETTNKSSEKEKNLMKTIEELELLLMQEKDKVRQLSNEKQTTELNLSQEKLLISQELSQSKEQLGKVTQELEVLQKDFGQSKDLIQPTKADASKKYSDDEIKKSLENTTKELMELKKTKIDLENELKALKKELSTSADEKVKTKEESKATGELKSKFETLQKTFSDLQAENDKLLKEKEKSKAASASSTKEKEPASWRWEKQDLEKQAKEFKKKYEDLQAEMKKTTAKTKDVTKENGTKSDSKEISKLSEECEQYKKQLEEMKKKLAEFEENFKKKEKVEKELKEAVEKAGKEKTEASKAKDLVTKQKDDVTTEKKKLTKDLETEKKRNEDLTKEKERMAKEKEEWTSEKKKLLQERDAALKEKEDLAKEKTKKDSEDSPSRYTPLGLRSKIGLGGKASEATADSTKIKELTESLEKKEAELKALKAKVESKGSGEKLNFQAREVTDLKREKERLEQDLEKSVAERKGLKSEIQELKEKLKSSEDTWTKEKVQLEQDLKQASNKSRSSSKSFSGSEDSKVVEEKESLIKEKLKLTEEITKLKKDFGELEKHKNSEKEEFEKKIKEKRKSLEESKANCDELQKEIERLKMQEGSSVGSKAAPGSSKIITIPVQQDRSVKSIPIQKISSKSSNSSEELDPALQKAELVALEEIYRSRTKNLEEELTILREQLSSVRKESEEQSQKSKKSFVDLKANFEKEFSSWNKERELLKKTGKLADEYSAKLNKLDKRVEELNGKLKTEEAKRRELEVKLVAQENCAKTNSATDEKSKVPEDTTTTGQKTSEFRNRFEKFGGTPRPARKLSLPSSSISTTTSSSDSSEKGDWVGEIQRQMTDAEKARLKDREELLEKMERQKKDFELKLESFKETIKMLDAKSQELSSMEKKMAEVHCQLEEERSNWSKERSKLQSKLTNAQKSGLEDKDKIAELSGEVKKLQLLASSGKSGTTSLSGTSTLLAPSTPVGTDKQPGFKGKIQSSDNLQNSTSSPVTSIVIPVRKVDSEIKTPTEDGTPASTPTANGVGKLSKKLFPPFATDSQQSNSSSTKSYMPGQRTPIPINRINRSNMPKV